MIIASFFIHCGCSRVFLILFWNVRIFAIRGCCFANIESVWRESAWGGNLGVSMAGGKELSLDLKMRIVDAHKNGKGIRPYPISF